jgi:PAS domain S-box-containing protein
LHYIAGLGETARTSCSSCRRDRTLGCVLDASSLGREYVLHTDGLSREPPLGGCVQDLNEADVGLIDGPRRFCWLVESLVDCAVALVDANGRILSWNRGAQLITGYSPREAIGTHLKLCCGLDKASWRAEAQALETGLPNGPLEINGWRTRKDGSKYWSSAVLTPVCDEAGKKRGFVELSRDITQRKRIDDRLRHAQEQLAEAEQLAQLGSWEWDLIEDRVWWSDELYRIFGVAPNQSPPSYQALLERIHPADRARLDSMVQRIVGDPGSFRMQVRILRPDKRVRVLQSRGEVLVDAAGRAITIVGTAQDITDLNQAQHALGSSADELGPRAAELRARARDNEPNHPPNAAGLTARQQEVLALVAEGLENRAIARRLVVSETTVKSHLREILRRLDAANRTEAVARYLREAT